MKIDNEIHETKQEILRTEQRLIELNQKLKNLEKAKEKGIPLDEHLRNITDFPLSRYSLWDLEFNIFGIPVPDKVFFLNMPPKASQKLMEHRKNKFSGEEKKDIHESNPEYLNTAYENACSLIKKYNWTEIICTKNDELRTINDIHEEIYKNI